jgi:RNA polymerase sigma-70 factor (ECF subfamily)
MADTPARGKSTGPLAWTPAAGLPDVPADSTASLVCRAQEGDVEAQERLFSRCLPALRRWARGRLPAHARDLVDTYDIVQEAALSTVRNLKHFTPEHPGAFMGYLREAVHSKIKDQLRRVQRRPVAVSLDDQPDDGQSPLERAIGRQQAVLYEAALARLSSLDRAAIVARIELHQSYEEISQALGKPTANAARVAVVRALERLVRELDHVR